MTERREIDMDPVLRVEAEITEFLRCVPEVGLVRYNHVMKLIWGMDRDQMMVLLNSIMPRFLQGAADMAQMGARATRIAESMRLGYPPVGIPPCSVNTIDPRALSDIELDVVHKNGKTDLEVKITSATDGAEPTERGCCHLCNDKGIEYLVLRFWRNDVKEWLKEWLWSSLEDDSHEIAPKGLSIMLEQGFEFSFDNPNPLVFRSRGWRPNDGELVIGWEDGRYFFSRVLPVSVREVSGPDEGDSVYVTLLLDGPYHDEHDEPDYETGQEMRPSREGYERLAAKFGVTDDDEDDDEAE